MAVHFEKRKKKDVVIPFRTTSEIQALIEEVAQQEQISASNVVNSIISSYFQTGETFYSTDKGGKNMGKK